MGKTPKYQGQHHSDDIVHRHKDKHEPKEPIFDDPTCIDGAIGDGDDDDDDNVDIDWLLQPPIFNIVGEEVHCHKNGRVSITLVVEYEAWDDDAFEYEWSIEEVD